MGTVNVVSILTRHQDCTRAESGVKWPEFLNYLTCHSHVSADNETSRKGHLVHANGLFSEQYTEGLVSWIA